MTARRYLFIALITFAFSFSSFAQQMSVSGIVQDSAQAPIAGAVVILRNTRTGQERVATTNAEGKFEFTGIGSDEFEVIGTATGFGRSSATSANSSNIVLTLEPSVLREEVTVVSGSRQEELRESLTTKVDVLTRNDIKNTGYETVGEALREIPGVITRRGSETTPPAGEQVQGVDSRQVLVLMDGQPVTGARGIKSGIINLDRQQINQLESVEVVKGATSSLYGSDAIGGVINLRTREQTSPFNASANFAGGNFGAVDLGATTGFVKDRLSGLFTFGRHKNNGFDLFPADFTTDGSGYHRYDAYGKLKYQFTDNFSLIGFGNSYWNNARGRVIGEPGPGNANGRQIIDVDDDSQNYGLTADWAINGKTNLQVRGYLSRFDEIYRNTTQTGVALPDGNLFERYGKFDFSLTRVIGDRNVFQAGAEFIKNKYSGLFRLQGDRGRSSTQVVWLQDKFNILNNLTLTVGGRYDHHSEFGNAFSPKFGLNFKAMENISLRASWGRGFRAPDLGQLFYSFRNPLFGYQVLGNKSLAPEHSGSWQVGGDYIGLGRKLRFGLNFYRNDIRNLINSVQIGTALNLASAQTILNNNGVDPSVTQYITGYPVILFAYKNLANVYTQGVEADVSYLLPRGFSVNGAYTFLEAIDKANERFLTGRHMHHGFAKIAYENARYGVNANFRGTFFGNWWATATRKAAAFQLFDLYGSKDIYKSFQIYGSVDNIFNSQDPNTGKASPTNPLVPLTIDRADMGRTFRVGIRWSFDRKK
jgi:outer membrane receptor for ferrienterochelin and colicins